MGTEKILDYLPEFNAWVKRRTLRSRIVLIIAALLIITSVSLLKGHIANILSFAIIQYSLTLPVFIWGILSLLIFFAGVLISRPYLMKRGNYFEFIKLWDEYKEILWSIENLKYFVYEEKDQSHMEDLLKYVRRCHEVRGKLKVLMAKIGEDNLCPLNSGRKWNAVLEQHAHLKKENYASPFSCLTDFVNPIAFYTHHKDYIDDALYAADICIDNLKHTLLSKEKLYREIEHRRSSLEKTEEGGDVGGGVKEQIAEEPKASLMEPA